MQLLTEVGLGGRALTPAADLAYGSKRALELATTLALEPQLLLLDEPTQGMAHEDVARVTHLLRKVSAGRTVLMVEHNMRVVATIADTISVLQRGRVIAAGGYAEVARDPQVIEAYMGSAATALADGGATLSSGAR
jgi:branched-chain amino acid transport system ATP-binding protein